MKKLSLDFDGTICDSNSALCEIIYELLGIKTEPKDFCFYGIDKCLNLTKRQTEEIINELSDIERTTNLVPYPGALEFIKYWHDLGNEINIVTNRGVNRGTEEVIHLFFEKHLPDICVNVYSSRNKGETLRKLGMEIHIDDHPEVPRNVADYGIYPIVYDQPYNRCLSRRMEELSSRVYFWREIRRMFIDNCL